jgi:ribonucleoside-diphosphate reductase alpha chain
MDFKEWLTQGRGEQYYTQLQEDIWEKKYRYNRETFEEWVARVSGYDADVAKLIKERKFLFGGRILATRGIDKTATYSNCYVVPSPKDSIKGIYDTAYEIAQTLAYGGGAGVDIGTLRPSGACVSNQAKTTSGAVSFLELFAMTSQIIGQNGRRGALMVSLPVWHPDVEEFIALKQDTTKATKANLSLRVDKEFFDSVKYGTSQTVEFVYETNGEKKVFKKQIDGNKVFDKICRVAWETAEVGMLYWDNIEKGSLVSEHPDFKFAGVNPCAEQPLPAYGSCLLGSLNLSEFVLPCKNIDYVGLHYATKIATRALNDVQDEGINRHPLPQNKQCVEDWRQIGLGVMGVADAMLKCGIKYGSDESLLFIDAVLQRILISAFVESARIGEERGNFKAFNTDYIQQSAFYKAHKDIIDGAWGEFDRKHLRNSQLLTIAPTGTISTLLGVSGGIEPLFATHYTRKTESLHGEDKYYSVAAPIIEELFQDGKLPEYVVTAHDIHYSDRIEFQSIAQKHIDASISSTINLPNEATQEDIGKLYIEAGIRGLKGVTVYRDGCYRQGVLEVKQKETSERKCPECGVGVMVSGGCSICLECGHSECG